MATQEKQLLNLSLSKTQPTTIRQAGCIICKEEYIQQKTALCILWNNQGYFC